MHILKISTIFLALSAASCASTAPTNQANAILNGGFETASTADPRHPADWNEDGKAPLYELDSATKRAGKNSMRIAFKDGSNKEGYSGVMQRVDVSAYVGKRIALDAFFRRSSPKSQVGIWLSLGGAEGKRLAYINSYEQPIADGSAWSRHHLELDIPPEATRLLLGAAIHESDGDMWVDDVSLTVVDPKKGS